MIKDSQVIDNCELRRILLENSYEMIKTLLELLKKINAFVLYVVKGHTGLDEKCNLAVCLSVISFVYQFKGKPI